MSALLLDYSPLVIFVAVIGRRQIFGDILGKPRNPCRFRGIVAVAACQRTRVSGRMTVMPFRTDVNHRYS